MKVDQYPGRELSSIEAAALPAPAVLPKPARPRAILPAEPETIASVYRRTASPIRGHYAAWKRRFDIVASFILLILLSPLMLIVAFLIILDSPGSAIYAQWRKGRFQLPFRMYKFRTMRKDAHQLRAALENENEVDGIIFKIRNDSRITRIGSLLRKYSIDELPQLLNVIKGDMSLIGPRPFPLEDFEGRRVDHPLFNQWLFERHKLLPGLTGLWQVSGRNDLPFTELMRFDLEYIHRASPAVDLAILWRTLGVVFKKQGAY